MDSKENVPCKGPTVFEPMPSVPRGGREGEAMAELAMEKPVPYSRAAPPRTAAPTTRVVVRFFSLFFFLLLVLLRDTQTSASGVRARRRREAGLWRTPWCE